MFLIGKLKVYAHVETSICHFTINNNMPWELLSVWSCQSETMICLIFILKSELVGILNYSSCHQLNTQMIKQRKEVLK